MNVAIPEGVGEAEFKRCQDTGRLIGFPHILVCVQTVLSNAEERFECAVLAAQSGRVAAAEDHTSRGMGELRKAKAYLLGAEQYESAAALIAAEVQTSYRCEGCQMDVEADHCPKCDAPLGGL